MAAQPALQQRRAADRADDSPKARPRNRPQYQHSAAHRRTDALRLTDIDRVRRHNPLR
jgi:hypothetical protein